MQSDNCLPSQLENVSSLTGQTNILPFATFAGFESVHNHTPLAVDMQIKQLQL